MNIQERVVAAKKSSRQRETIAWAAFEGQTMLAWNCAGEVIELNFSHPQLRVLPITVRRKFRLDSAGAFVQWANGIKFNPFDCCVTCGLYHPGMTHSQYLQRKIM